MDWPVLWDRVKHPQRALQNWRETRAAQYCEVCIDHPPMKIRGKKRRNAASPKSPGYYSFLGVPYAQPPKGELRFKPPKPIETTTRSIPSLNAKKKYNACIQHDSKLQMTIGSEDCLYLNIYAPKEPKLAEEKMPVLVFIHGGAFERGNGDIKEVEPDFIMKHDLIFVTVNYRLHVLGFLNAGIEECSGNAGLKDQVQALRWIKDNIDRFGGDPDNVTLSGSSAGATCVNLHMISPLSQDLFHKAIVQGGGLYCPWGYQDNGEIFRELIAKKCKLVGVLPHILVEILKRQYTAKELLNLYRVVRNDVMWAEPNRMMIVIGPTKERASEEAFLPEDVEVLMKRAKPKPLIAGIAEEEGYMYILNERRYHPDGFRHLVQDDERFQTFLTENFQWKAESAHKHLTTIRNRYFEFLSLLDSDASQDFVAILCTDIMFRRFYDNFRIGGQTPPLFFVYQFSYIPDTMAKDDEIEYKAPTHADDMKYLYGLQEKSYLNSLPEVERVRDHMCRMWSKFCLTGDPSIENEDVKWTPHTDENPCYLKIGATSQMVQSRLHEERWRFINNLVSQEPVVRTSCRTTVL